MLDQLVESKSNAGVDTRRGEFMLGTTLIVVGALLALGTYGLFKIEIGGVKDLELSDLVAPVALPEDAPPPPEPKEEKAPATDKVVVKELVASIDRTTEPPKDTLGKAKVQAIRDDTDLSKVEIGDKESGSIASISGKGRGGGTPGMAGAGGGGDDEDDAPPPPKPKPTKPISGGVLNGKAVSLAKPPYPAAARAVRASGAVNVQVTIDESGNVISAAATSGHPLLRAAAVDAARRSRFSPTTLSGQAVKVTGTIVYNFVP